MSFCLQALSVSMYVLQVRRFSVCSCVRAAMTADASACVLIVTVDPGFVGKTNVVADSKAYTEGGAVIERCPGVPHPRFEYTDALLSATTFVVPTNTGSAVTIPTPAPASAVIAALTREHTENLRT